MSAQHTPLVYLDTGEIYLTVDGQPLIDQAPFAVLTDPDDAAGNLMAAGGDLLAALEAMIPSNLGPLPAGLPDDAILPCDITVGEVRRARAAIAKARG